MCRIKSQKSLFMKFMFLEIHMYKHHYGTCMDYVATGLGCYCNKNAIHNMKF